MASKKEEVSLPALIKDAKLSKIDVSRIEEQYKEINEAAQDWAKKAKLFVITDPTQKADMASCKAGYEFLRTKFNEIESLRKELKEEPLRRGQAIDAIANKFKELIEPIMNDLKVKSEFAKNYSETQIKERGQKRLDALAAYDVFMSIEDAAAMLDDVYENYLGIAKKNFEAKQNSEPAILVNGGVHPVVGSEPMIGVSVDHTNGKFGAYIEKNSSVTIGPIQKVGTESWELSKFIMFLEAVPYPNVTSEEGIKLMQEVEQDLTDAINRIKRYLDGTKS